jgi:hypothetical protein
VPRRAGGASPESAPELNQSGPTTQHTDLLRLGACGVLSVGSLFCVPPVSTAAELLTSINAAILQLVQDGASMVEVRGQRYTALDLDQLRLMRRELKIEAAEEASAPAGGRRGPIIQGFR